MLDRYGRKIEYLRISVTQNCNLKCIYCNPDGSLCHENCEKNLSPAEIESVTQAMTKVGIRKVRITGGEPLVRGDICEIISRISGINRINDISMTTNGINLSTMAKDLKRAGLQRLNISLDSLNEDKFRQITGGGELKKTLAGIDLALELGMAPIKINTVLIKGVNDDEIDDIIELARQRPIEVRFIELMPMGCFGEENAGKIISNDDIIRARPHLKVLKSDDKASPAIYYGIDGFAGKIGFISPMTHQFCSECNRVRLTSDGRIRLCLGNNDEVDIRKALDLKPKDMGEIMRQIVFNKPVGHHFKEPFSSSRRMQMIGG
jgi:cyclic pyranopterin phosphate synthase